MASVWFILVALCIGHVFAETSRNCSPEVIEKSCDDCIKCGGNWCISPDSKTRCSFYDNDDCSEEEQVTPSSPPASDRNIFVKVNKHRQVNLQELYYESEISPILLESSIKGVTEYKQIMKVYTEDDISTSVNVIPNTNFCPAQSRREERVTILIRELEGNKTANITVTVPCQCSCSKAAIPKSDLCNKRGSYACAVCICEEGWQGPKCETKVEIVSGDGNQGDNGTKGGNGNKGHDGNNGKPGSEKSRGDIGPCEVDGITCSNNGICVDGKCVCNNTREGYQYFNEQCMSICSNISATADACLTDPPEQGICKHNHNVYIDNFNRTILNETNDKGTKVWVNCTETTSTCTIVYAAKRDSNNVHHVMFLEPCNALLVPPSAVTYGTRVPVQIGLAILAVIVAAAAVAGFMVWKNRQPPLPLNDPGYGKIDAEDCTGLNPLYKPPTSSFKNPTYGKW